MGVVFFVFFVFAVMMFGQVSGEEFSPQKFRIRSFSYVQIPFVRLQVWPVSFVNATGVDDALANHIRRTTRSNNLMAKVRSAPQRWDIMTMHQVGSKTYRGDASILTNYLRQPGATGMETWLDWSKANPKLAAELWGIVAQLANEDLYPIIPDVLEAARRLDGSGFKLQLRKIVDQECQKFAKAYVEAGDTQRATQVKEFARYISTTSSDATPVDEPVETKTTIENAESEDVTEDLP